MKSKKIVTLIVVCMISLTGFCQSETKINREKLAQALTKYDNFEMFSEGLCLVQKNGKYGFIDKEGKEIVPCIYLKANYFHGGAAKVEKYLKGYFGYINQLGKEIVPCVYTAGNGNSGSLLLVKWQGMDKAIETGMESAKYYSIGDFSENFCTVEKEGKWGYIDINGIEIVPCIYDEVQSFSEGLALVVKNGKAGFIDKSGQAIIPCIYDNASKFTEGSALVEKNGKVGFVNTLGKEIVPCIYDNALNFSEGLAFIIKNGKWGFIDETGKEVIPCINDIPTDNEFKEECIKRYSDWKLFSFTDGLALVVKNGKLEFIDKLGNKVLSDRIGVFSERLAKVEKNEKYGFVDEVGKEIIPCVYDKVENFENDVAFVQKDGKWGLIDKTGKEIIPCTFDWHQTPHFSNGLALIDNYLKTSSVNNNMSFGFIDTEGYFIGRGVVKNIMNSENNSNNISTSNSSNKTVEQSDNSWLIGSWECDKSDCTEEEIEFKQDGNFEKSGDGCVIEGKYTVENNMIHLDGIIRCMGDRNNYSDSIAIQGNNLNGYKKIVIQDSANSTIENNSDNEPSSSNAQVDLSNLPPIQVIQAYAAGKTFVADNGWKFKIQSGIEVYMNGNLFGSISEYYDVRINSNNGRQYFPFNVVSPYNHAEFMFAFYPPDIIRDQEGRNYYLK